MEEKKSGFSALSILAFSIGTSIGWGSFLVPCSTYLLKAGLLGTILGLFLGLAFILVIAWNLQYMISKVPSEGGVYAFEKNGTGGRELGFLSFWFILLTYLALLWTNVTSLPLFAGFFLKNTFKFGFSYTIFGYEVWLGEALLCIAALILIGFICSKSTKVASRIMIVSTLVFTVGFIFCALVAAFKHGNAFSYSPLFLEESEIFSQIMQIAVISPWAFIGFECVAYFSSEISFPVKKMRKVLLLSVIVVAILFIAVSLLSVSAYPAEYGSWLEYIQDMGNLKGLRAVPAFFATYTFFGRTGVVILMLALAGVILSSLIGNTMVLSRLLSSAAKEGDVPSSLSSQNKAIVAIVVFSFVIPFLGRTATRWIVDIATICATIVHCIISHSAYSKARQLGDKREQITGIAGMVLMLSFTIVMLIPGILPFLNIEEETYILFIAWILLGLLYFRLYVMKKKKPENFQNAVVWVVPLLLVLFASMMLVSRLTETAADKAVDLIYEYHQENPGVDTTEEQEIARKEFLHEQEKRISNTNTIFSIFSLGLFMVFAGIVFTSRKDFKVLGKRLSEAEKIVALKESVSTLINNMPVMCFSKDAETGKYLACNKMFADYAVNGDPSAIAGLTDYDFVRDKKHADKYAAEDRLVLSMDKPLVRYGQSRDSSGITRSIQSTKLKFRDSTGRLCILGMLVDVTEVEKLKSSNAAYESIVKALADNYFNVFYVNLKTDEYLEYGVRTEYKHSFTERRGEGFFRTIISNARALIYAEDLDRALTELNKDFILQTIEKKGFYEIEYRLVLGGVPTHVCLKAKLSENDDNHLIVGISNINSLVKGRETIRQAEEERKTYLRLSALNGNLVVLYYVDPETEAYTEFTTTDRFEELGIEKHGDQFFKRSHENAVTSIHPDDINTLKTQFTKKNVLKVIERDGVFALDYRLKLNDRYIYMRLKAACVEESGKKLLIVGAFDVDAQVRQEQEIEQDLSEARTMAQKDSLTGLLNKRAYLDAEADLNKKIASGDISEFAIVVFDINDLKKVNDTQGHKAGDDLIKNACSIICNIFKHSPVYRVGGDEFVAICQGSDYESISELMAKMDISNKNDIQIAYGMSYFNGKDTVLDVFERADQAMYKKKIQLKENK